MIPWSLRSPAMARCQMPPCPVPEAFISRIGLDGLEQIFIDL